MTEFRPRPFQMIPPVIKNLLIINVLIFLAQQAFGRDTEIRIDMMFGLHDFRSSFFRIYQVITYMFLHGGWEHIIFNMFALWMFGSVLENYWGGKRFFIFYIICGIGAAICDMGVRYFANPNLLADLNSPLLNQEQAEDIVGLLSSYTIGASGAIFGCLAGFGYLFPNNEILILPIPFPVKAKWVVIGYGAIELFAGFRSSPGDNVAHWAHLGGALFGILLVMYWNRNNRRHSY
jgi:membrane associated rhomboid family serine protease